MLGQLILLIIFIILLITVFSVAPTTQPVSNKVDIVYEPEQVADQKD
jgi:hypothetical protein